MPKKSTKKQVRKKPQKRASLKKGLAQQLIAMPEGAVGFSSYADWIEVSVWAQGDQRISRQDVLSRFKSGDDNSQETVNNIWDELKTRKLLLGNAYPFSFSDNEELFFLKKENEVNISYIFCLLISYFGLSDLMSKNTSLGSHIFEDLCTNVANTYVSDAIGTPTDHLQFGAPRMKWLKKQRPFNDAVDVLIKHLGEGANRVSGVRDIDKTVADGGDGGLDIVAWRKFPDNRLGYLCLFGQCATAKKHSEYMSKLSEHKEFLNKFLSSDIAPIFVFFIPHTLSTNDQEENNHWEEIKRTKNIPFDRIRISMYGHGWIKEEMKTYFSGWRKKIQDEHFLI